MTRITAGGCEWELTRHAIDRALEMDLDGRDIVRCLESPDDIVPSVKYPNSKHYKFADFALSVAFDGPLPTIVTCVWGTDAAWQRDFTDRPAGDRTYRPNGFHIT